MAFAHSSAGDRLTNIRPALDIAEANNVLVGSSS